MKTVAVVEDNPDNRLLVRVILESLYKVVEFDNGPAALAELPQAPPDVLLLDVSLPEMDGLEVLKRMRADARLRSVPVIALTAHAMAGDRERFLAQGFDDYVSKPIVDEKLLLDAIEHRFTSTTPALPKAPELDINPEGLVNLVRLGGEKFAMEMLELFVTFGGAKMAEAQQALGGSNLAALAAAVHALKSSAGNIGATRVFQLAAQVEETARTEQLALARTQFQELEQAFGAASRNLTAERDRLSGKQASESGH